MTRDDIKIYVLDYLAGRLTCKEWVEMVTNYLEGRMPFLQRLRFHLHLGMCLGCRNYLQQIRQTIRLMGELPKQSPPPEVQAELVRRFRSLKTFSD
jgi:predicted anti-sigma-YlaC factor YlaD